jgi:diphosphomevalonate decarboxylase
MTTATALAHPNIAFIKYWGNRDERLRLPANSSISMNLGDLHTRTRVTFEAGLPEDVFTLDGEPVSGPGLQRVGGFLSLVRQMSGVDLRARVDSRNSFPTGAGIASSASAFAALSLAASEAAGLALSEAELSRLARRGSGSACRSIPGGFVEWQAGEGDEESFAFSIAPPVHWDLIDCVAIVSRYHKETGSTAGHALAGTSPLQAARVADAPRRLEACRRAILERDFEAFAAVVELDSNLMHAVMMTSTPALLYWQPATVAVMRAVKEWRQSGEPVCYTIDAGPNVHVLCPANLASRVVEWLAGIPGVENVLTSRPGGPARLLDESLPD